MVANPEPSAQDARTTLGVTAAATPAQVVTAFRHRAQTVHPDVSHAGDSTERFTALVAAYHVALHAARREDTGRAVPKVASAASEGPSPITRTQVTTGPAGTAIWEAGRFVLLIAPVTAHQPPARATGQLEGRRH